MKNLYLLTVLLMFIGMIPLIQSEITPNFPGNQPLIIDGNNQPSTEDKLMIDSFEIESETIVILLNEDAPPTVSNFDITTNPQILGGERDIILTVSSGKAGRVITAGVNSNQFQLATPSDVSGVCDIQYDGIDGSPDLSITGLGNIDLTLNNSLGFRIRATTDISTGVIITVYSGNGVSSSFRIAIIGNEVPTDYQIPFNTFSVLVDFADIVAIVLSVEANENVDLYITEFAIYGDSIPPSGVAFADTILPCDTHYYRIRTLTDLRPGDYVKISFNQSSEFDSLGVLYVSSSNYANLADELTSNVNIVDTLGELPGPTNYVYKCDVAQCTIEITSCQLEETTYYLAIAGNDAGLMFYSVDISLRRTPVYQIFPQTPQTLFFDQRPDTEDHTLFYSYYLIDIPESLYSDGTYLVVNITNVQSIADLEMRLNYGGLPESSFNTGVIGSTDFSSSGEQVDDCTFQFCVDTSRASNEPYFDHPVAAHPRIPCVCTTSNELGGPNTCNITVDPCHFRYGTWYISILLPPNTDNRVDASNYTIIPYIIQPAVHSLFRNESIKGSVYPERSTHYKLTVPASDVTIRNSSLIVQISNIRNGFVNLWVHHEMGGSNNLAGPEGCVPSNATCRSRDSCTIVIEKCYFVPGTWYMSVSIDYNATSKEFAIFEPDRLPITFTINATWVDEPAPIPLFSGVPVIGSIGESLYHFYVLNVPKTIDTWLFVEFYSRCEDTDVILSILHGSLPGGECYDMPDFYCITGFDGSISRKSCTFMIQTCELEAGPLFFSVYGYHTNLEVYGNTTFYQIPSQYTLYVDFDTALPLRNGVSYQDSVVEFQYQHYYIRADRVYQGSYLTAEVTNIQHGTPQSLALFVNYNYLAGDCPCYDNLYNCTGKIVEDEASFENFTCCTIVVPPSDFRGGVWYISVLGMNQDSLYSTPIGYTLTVTVHYPPEFFPLFLGQEASATVPKFNASLEYTHFKLAAVPIPLHDLVFTIVYNQNCFFLGKHDNSNDSLSLFVKANVPANERAYDYSCQASVSSESYCTIVVPHCEWISNDYFLSVQGVNTAEFDARFTLRAKLEEIRDFQLTSGVTVYNRVTTGTYKHFFIDTNGIHNNHLEINLYTNQDQDVVSVYLNFDSRAGTFPCYSNIDSCEQQRVCFWQINAVDIKDGRYYISVFGERQWYDTPVEFTLTAEFKQFSLRLNSLQPFTNHIIVEQKHYYRYSVNELDFGDHLSILVDNVDYGAVTVYVNYNYAAGTCPGYLYEQSCYASSLNTDWCQIRIPSCELKLGDYFITVVGESSFSECENPLQKIGYSIEVRQITPSLVYPEVNVGRDMNNAEHFQFIPDANYVHYQFRYTKNDYLNGYHIMVEIFNVLEGSLFAYYNKGSSSDSDIDCQLAQICNNGLSSNGDCIWQIPFSLSKPTYVDNGDDDINMINFQYITIESLSGRSMASYSILIWKQPSITVLANPTFTLDNTDSSYFFPANTELNITHFDSIQPNGGVQFIKLLDVPPYSEGDMLEVFFYRVINNPGESTSFNVYIFPEMPAGAHECCERDPSTIGSCLGAPSLRTVDTTTQATDGSELISHLCDLPDGVGFSEDDPFFGYRCTVRVWPCTFSRYCEEATTWWMSIVPTEPTPIEETGPLDGLSYSVQWRTRNIRMSDQFLADSISLNEYINTFEFSETIPLYSSNTESEGWMSFYIDVVPSDHSRISIQTDFLNGTGEVYIQPGVFASPPFDLCSSYYCTTNSDADCRDVGRFISDECHSTKHSRYYITVRSLSGADTITLVSFRIIKIDQPAIVQIPAHLTSTNPFKVTSGLLPSENYDTYVMPIDDSDIADHQTLLIDVTRPPNDGGSLILYVRYGSQAGDFVGGSNTLNAQGCYTWLYSCELPDATSRCTLQIPHSDLIQGYWYISLYNPDFNYNGISDNLPEYSMVVYLQSTPIELQLGVPFIGDISNEFPGTYINYRLTVTANDIGLYGPKENTGIIYNGDYHTSYLRFILDDFEGNITMYINYDDLAGEPTQLYNPYGYYQQSLDYIRSIDCSSDSLCNIDILPCDRDNQKSFKLKSGIYYISLLANDTVTSFNISAYVLTENYVVMNEENVGRSNHHLWMHTANSDNLMNEGDGYFYRYTFNTVDDIRAYDYMIINFTMPEEFISEDVTLDLKIWRDDCSVFTCSLPIDGESWCVVDAVSLAPCNLKGGRYYFEVFNPNSIPFSIIVYQNETITQRLIDQQIITEVINQYEYQEYFFEAVDVMDGATLTVQVCAECGEVETWIRPRHPAGPNCGIDHCSVSSSDSDERSCCTMFLDTCQYSQQGYYIAVRGVSTDFPNEVNPTLYLPAKYQIQANQTNIQVDHIAFVCPIKRSSFDTFFPSQYAIDLESANIGTLLRFTLVLPEEVRLLQNEMEEVATLSISYNRTVGYTVCDNSPFTCSIGFEQDTLRCEVIIPAVFVSTGRYYIWADAPEGSIISVERWDPYIPIIQPNLLYSATLNGPIDSIIEPYQNRRSFIEETREDLFMPATQYYRFNLDLDELYNETFFLRVLIQNIRHGTISATLNSGFFPLSEVSPNKPTPIFLDNYSCTFASDGYDCAIDLALCDLFPNEDDFQRSLASTFWITVTGLQQVAELHPIQYSLLVQTNWIFTYYPIDHTVCNSVEVNEYNFHRIRPRAQEVPQHSFLRFHLSRIDANNGNEVAFLLKDNSVPTRGCYDLAVRSGIVFGEGDNEGVGTINVDWLCPYQNLYLSVFGISSMDGPIDYLMNVTRVPVKVIELFNDQVYHRDDDDTDACGSVNGEYDFYIFNATASQNAHSAFMRVAVHSEFPFTVYLNKGGFGFEECHIDKASSEGGSVNLYDFCTYSDSSYFITVVSTGPYYIYTHVRDDSKALTLGQVYRDTLEQGQYQMYTLEICDHWFAADDRLVIEISDVQNGGVIGWIQLNSNAGPFSTSDENGFCNIPNTRANAEYELGRSGYDFILIDHSILSAGTYHILIQAQSHSNSEFDNPQFVSFRLFPYLDDLEIDPTPISPNTIIPNQAVDFFNLDRYSNQYVYPHTRYYQMQPLTEGDFTFAFSQIRLQNVKGGNLNLRVTVGHLATPPFDFITGKSQALLRGINFDRNIHSGRRPYTLQQISDRISEFYPDCDGSSDFCSFMSADKDPQYKTSKSSAVWIPSCAFNINSTLYISVEASHQFNENTPISFELVADQIADYTFLPPDTGFTNEMTQSNWQYHFYRSIQSTLQSARWRVVVSEGEGVLVTVRNHRCPLQATWTREIWCDANYFGNRFICDIEIPTEAAHPGDNAFFISVYGRNATYTIAYWRGLQNCHAFHQSGYPEGLNFCAGIVDYPTWRWDDYQALDHEANCFFEELYQHFKVQPCWSGVTSDCNATLRQFACFESFKGCDQNGFYLGTCRSACDAVVYQCTNWFQTVDLEHYNCTSSRYISDGTSYCTGGSYYSWLNENTQLFFGNNPADILFDPYLNRGNQSSAPSLTLSSILFVALFAIFFL